MRLSRPATGRKCKAGDKCAAENIGASGYRAGAFRPKRRPFLNERPGPSAHPVTRPGGVFEFDRLAVRRCNRRLGPVLLELSKLFHRSEPFGHDDLFQRTQPVFIIIVAEIRLAAFPCACDLVGKLIGPLGPSEMPLRGAALGQEQSLDRVGWDVRSRGQSGRK